MDEPVSAVSAALSCAAPASPSSSAAAAAAWVGPAAWVGFSCALALFMAARGFRKRSLSSSGAAAAFVVGSLTMTAGARPTFHFPHLPVRSVPHSPPFSSFPFAPCARGGRFGVTLIAFFLSSSKLTRLGAQHKRRVEERFKEGGQRDGWQVLSNSIAATTVALLFLLLVLSPGSFPGQEASPPHHHATGMLPLSLLLSWTPSTVAPPPLCTPLSKKPPLLITTLQVRSLCLSLSFLNSISPLLPSPTP
ncbi:unnamed protein product [Closterium sp. NIES-65]|nr:unnamed protein product [Closterium sp. NIES-65]